MNNSWIERKKTNPIFVGSVGVGWRSSYINSIYDEH
jgi:hypothetical protein